jgi:hypothetical protein
MWSSSRRTGAIVASLVLLLPLAGCSGLRPVYGDGGLDQQRLAISYAEPNSRLEQIIYKDLALKLGRGDGGPTVTVATTQSNRDLTIAVINQARSRSQVTVVATVTVRDADGTTLYTGRLSQAADYTVGPQVLANQEASEDAADKAAHLLADTIRLAILGALSK